MADYILNDTYFIADTHYNTNRNNLKTILLKIQSKEIKISRLFLLGDIFDFLAPQIKYFVKQNQDIINLLNELSLKIEIIYLEGNHDFNLQPLFSNIQVIPREKQPYIYNLNDKKIALAHGDIFMPLGYEIYTAIIRNTFLLKFLNFIDINNWLTKKIDNWLKQKDINNYCQDIDTFVSTRLKLYDKYNITTIIEGHFHYGIKQDKYINI
jgi:UDP-2,3-diacylglucosamine hydrolase